MRAASTPSPDGPDDGPYDGPYDGPLHDPVGGALRGHHASYAVSAGSAVRYHPDVAPFAALAPDPGPGDWADLAQLLGPGGGAALIAPPPLPDGWSELMSFRGLRMVAPDARALRVTSDDLDATTLHPDRDGQEVADLVRRTEPGPFGPRTMELGRFLGVRQDGQLVALAGERMHPLGWTEISAVCTDPSARGQGLATRLVAAVTAGIHARGEGAFLHVLETNTAAVRVYERLGFTVHRTVHIVVVTPPP